MSSAQTAYNAWVAQGVAAGLGETSVPWESLSPGIRDRWSASIAAVRRGLRTEELDRSKARDSKAVADATSEAKQFQGQFATAHRDKQKAQSEVATLKIEISGLRTQLAEAAQKLLVAKGESDDGD